MHTVQQGKGPPHCLFAELPPTSPTLSSYIIPVQGNISLFQSEILEKKNVVITCTDVESEGSEVWQVLQALQPGPGSCSSGFQLGCCSKEGLQRVVINLLSIPVMIVWFGFSGYGARWSHCEC